MGTNRQTTPQSLTVEYTVRGSLDGVTPAPLVQIDQTRPDATPFDQTAQIYRPDPVDNLGLIDPDLLVGGSIGTRCIPFLSIDTTEVGAAGASVDIVGVRGSPSDVFFQKQIEDLVGDAGPIYLDGGFNVPQGSDIRVRGYTAAPGEEIRVRVTLLVPDNCLDVAAFHCPCPPNGNGPPPPPVDAGCLGKFLVATQADCAPFTSIGAAYQAAKDAGHGYGQPNGPAQVLVCPGDYDENILMDRAGIDVIAVAQNEQGENASAQAFGVVPAPIPGETRLAGTVTVDFGPTGGEPPRALWRGIDIVPESGIAVLFTGANNKLFKLQNCIVQSQDDVALRADSTAQGQAFNQVDIRNVSLGTLAQNNAAVEVGVQDPAVGHLLRTWNVNISVPFNNPLVMVLVNSEAVFDNTFVIGQTTLDSSFANANDSTFQATEATSAVFLDVDSFMQSIDCKYGGQSGGNGSFVDGEGVFTHDGVALFGDLDWGVDLVVFSTEGIPQEQHWTFVDLDNAGTFRITGECNLLVAGPGAPGPVIELPSSVFRPGPIRIIEDALTSAGPITLSITTLPQAPPGDLIVVGTDPPAATVVLPPAGAGVSGGYMLVSNGAGLWYAMCFCQDAGGAANCLTQALVSPDPTLAPFQSIQLAYNFLVGLGADPTTPAKVLVCPGEYTEDVLMSQPGVDIIAVDKDDYNELRNFVGRGMTRLNGTLTIDLTGVSPNDELHNCLWDGIDLVPDGQSLGNGLIFTGAQYQQAFVRHCLMKGTQGEPGLRADNSGVGNPGDSRLDVIRCGIENADFASNAGFEIEDGLVLLNDVVVRGAEPNVVVGTGVLEIVGSTVQNLTLMHSTVIASYTKWLGGITFIPGGAPFFNGLQCEYTSLPGGGVPGFFLYDQINTPATAGIAPAFDPAVAFVQKVGVPPGDNVAFFDLTGVVVPFPLAGHETNVVIQTDPAGNTVVLPPLAPAPLGNVRRGAIRIKSRVSANGAGPLTIVPSAALGVNTLNEGVGLAALASGDSATFISWVSPPAGAPPDWESWN